MSRRKGARRQTIPNKPKTNPAVNTYLQKAQEHFKSGETARALTMLEQAAKLAPNDVALQHKTGKQLADNKRHSDAIKYYEKALETDPDHVPSLIDLAQENSRRETVDKAEPLILKALELAPDSAPVRGVYGTILQKQGDLPKAVEQLRATLELRLNSKLPTLQPKAEAHDFNKPETEALLWKTLSDLAKAGVHAFPCFGTLLGIVREGGLLPFDKDMDLGAPYCELPRARRCLEQHGWVVARQKGMTNPLVLLHPASEITIDLSGFVVDEATGGVYEGIWVDNIPWEWARISRLPPLELKKSTSPDGKPIWMLQDPEQWLESFYGDWRTPDPNFDTIVAAKNLCGFPLMTQCYAFARLYDNWEKGKFTKALAVCNHSLRHLPDDDLLQRLRDALIPLADSDGGAPEPKAPSLKQPDQPQRPQVTAPNQQNDLIMRGKRLTSLIDSLMD